MGLPIGSCHAVSFQLQLCSLGAQDETGLDNTSTTVVVAFVEPETEESEGLPAILGPWTSYPSQASHWPRNFTCPITSFVFSQHQGVYLFSPQNMYSEQRRANHFCVFVNPVIISRLTRKPLEALSTCHFQPLLKNAVSDY